MAGAIAVSIAAASLWSSPSIAQQNIEPKLEPKLPIARAARLFLGGPQLDPLAKAPAKRPLPSDTSSVEFSARSGFVDRRIYHRRPRHYPTVACRIARGLGAHIHPFLCRSGVTSVKLPSQPAAEDSYVQHRRAARRSESSISIWAGRISITLANYPAAASTTGKPRRAPTSCFYRCAPKSPAVKRGRPNVFNTGLPGSTYAVGGPRSIPSGAIPYPMASPRH